VIAPTSDRDEIKEGIGIFELQKHPAEIFFASGPARWAFSQALYLVQF
jgi:hypothetical protein